jgi:uncharacterized phage protein (TIGR02218 family)
VIFSGATFQPVTISRGAFERNDEAASSTVTVNLDRTLKVVSQFLDGSTPKPVKLTIYRKHRTDSDFIVLFRGVVANAGLMGEEVQLTCVSPLSSDEKSIPRELIMRTCPHVHFGDRCQLDRTDWDYAGTISTISTTLVKVNGIANLGADYFNAGVIVHNATGFRSFIQDSRYFGGLNEVYLLQPPPTGWSVSDAVTLYAGCDRKHSTCRDKFDNIPNFGGFPLHPERNPILDLQGN